MFKWSVIIIHTGIIIMALSIGLLGKYNIAAEEPGKTYTVWFSAIAIYCLLVICSAIWQLKIRKVFVFLISIIVLLLIFYVLPHAVLYIENILDS